MTREDKNVWLSIKNEMVIRMSHKAIGMNELNKVFNFAEKIFDEHEAQLKQAYTDGSNSCNELIQLQHKQIEAKEEEIDRLKVSNKGYLIVLNDKLDRNNFLELQYEKYRKTLAMLFKHWKHYSRIRCRMYSDDTIKTSKTLYKKAYSMLKGE